MGETPTYRRRQIGTLPITRSDVFMLTIMTIVLILLIDGAIMQTWLFLGAGWALFGITYVIGRPLEKRRLARRDEDREIVRRLGGTL